MDGDDVLWKPSIGLWKAGWNLFLLYLEAWKHYAPLRNETWNSTYRLKQTEKFIAGFRGERQPRRLRCDVVAKFLGLGLALSPLSRKVPGSNQPLGCRGFCVWRMHVLLLPSWLLSGCSEVPPTTQTLSWAKMKRGHDRERDGSLAFAHWPCNELTSPGM